MRIAFFGGSFDPPHLGHLHIACAARDRLGLDAVLLAPVGRQPLKAAEATPFDDRLAMTRILVAGSRGLEASDVDRPRESPNYTAATLPVLRAALPEGTLLFLLAGADSFLSLRDWRSPELLLRTPEHGGLVDGWILAARPGFPLHAMSGPLSGALPAGFRLSADASGEEETARLWNASIVDGQSRAAMPLHLLPDLDDPATATRIREALRAGEPPPDLSPAVAAYINDHGLYRVLG